MEGVTTPTKQRLLLTETAKEFLTSCEQDLHSKLSKFLHQLAQEDWQDWMTSAHTTIRQERDGNRVLFTHKIHEDIVAQWERVWSVNLLGRLNYPRGFYSQEIPPVHNYFPHVVLYEFGPLHVSTEQAIPFQDTTFEAAQSTDDLDKLENEQIQGNKAKHAYDGFIKPFIEEKKQVLFEAFQDISVTELEQLTEIKRMLNTLEALDIEIKSILSVSSNFLSANLHALVIVLKGHVIKGTPKPGDDIVDLDWFRTDNLPEIAFSEDRYLIQHLDDWNKQAIPLT